MSASHRYHSVFLLFWFRCRRNARQPVHQPQGKISPQAKPAYYNKSRRKKQSFFNGHIYFSMGFNTLLGNIISVCLPCVFSSASIMKKPVRFPGIGAHATGLGSCSGAHRAPRSKDPKPSPQGEDFPGGCGTGNPSPTDGTLWGGPVAWRTMCAATEAFSRGAP